MMQGNTAAVKYDFNYCDWSKHFHINNCFLSHSLCRSESEQGKRIVPFVVSEETQFDKQLAAAIAW